MFLVDTTNNAKDHQGNKKMS